MRGFSFSTRLVSSPRPNVDLRQHLNKVHDGPYFGSVNLGWHRIYGGQLIGQSIAAASLGLDEKQKHQIVNSVRTRFIDSGDVNSTVLHETNPLRTGKNFSWIKVNCIQDKTNTESTKYNNDSFDNSTTRKKKLLASSVVSFKSMDANATGHDDDLETNLLSKYSSVEDSDRTDVSILGFDMKLARIKHSNAISGLWIRRSDHTNPWTVPEEQAALGYASDYFFLRTALHKHQIDVFDVNVRAASLCHSLFFHRQIDFSDWILFLPSSPFASAGRAMVEGRFLNRKGQRIASAVQEGLVWQRNKTTLGQKQNNNETMHTISMSFLPVKNDSTSLLAENKVENLQEALKEPLSTSGKTFLRDYGWNRMFGGQVLAQGLLKAAQALPEESKGSFLHSFHGHFVDAGKPQSPGVIYKSKLVRKGRIYDQTEMELVQDGRLLFRGDASFGIARPESQTNGTGIEHDDDLLDDDARSCKEAFDCLPQEDFQDDAERDYFMPHKYRVNFLSKMGLDMRQDFQFEQKIQRCFLRSRIPVESNAMSQALVAFAVDSLFPGAGISRHYPQMKMWGPQATVGCASLCSSFYFHRTFDLHKEWIVLRLSCPILMDSRAFIKVDFYRSWGKERVATAFQEVLIRPLKKST